MLLITLLPGRNFLGKIDIFSAGTIYALCPVDKLPLQLFSYQALKFLDDRLRLGRHPCWAGRVKVHIYKFLY